MQDLCVFACVTRGGDDNTGAEDDGYLVSVLVNGRDLTSELVVFDAQDVAKV